MYGKTERLEWNEKQCINTNNLGIDYLRGTEEIKKEYDNSMNPVIDHFD